MNDNHESKPIILTRHATERMGERGASEDDVREAIRIGHCEPAQRGLIQYRLNLEFNGKWDGRYYAIKQVVPIVAEEKEQLVVVTVYTFYFQEGDER